jgi:hypothetical protein
VTDFTTKTEGAQVFITKKILPSCSLALTLLLFLANPVDGNRVGHEGEDWLKMNLDMRQAYTTGYSFGFTDGLQNACLGIAKDLKQSLPGPENDPLQRCLQQGPKSIDMTATAKSVTEFYDRYPSDRYLYIRDVIGALFRGMTLQEIHNHASPGGVAPSN